MTYSRATIRRRKEKADARRSILPVEREMCRKRWGGGGGGGGGYLPGGTKKRPPREKVRGRSGEAYVADVLLESRLLLSQEKDSTYLQFAAQEKGPRSPGKSLTCIEWKRKRGKKTHMNGQFKGGSSRAFDLEHLGKRGTQHFAGGERPVRIQTPMESRTQDNASHRDECREEETNVGGGKTHSCQEKRKKPDT